jgi:tetratricopeptide (TPR) repeat protein
MSGNETDISKLQNIEQLWKPSDPGESERLFREMLPVAEQLTGQDRCHLIELHICIARSEMAQKKISEAHLSLATAERLLDEHRASYRMSSRIKWLLEAGRLHILEKTPSQARSRFAEAWTLSINSGEDTLASEVALMMAAVEPQKHQQEWIIRGIKIAEESPQSDSKRWLGTLYASLGWKLFDLRQYEAALAAFQKTLSFLKLNGTIREAFVAKWSIGKLLRSMGKFDEALLIQNALLAELGAGGAKDGRVFQELAECLHSLKRSPEAQVYFDLAYKELSRDEWIVDNQPEVLKRLKDLGKIK